MTQPSALVVDLDGTLIRGDLLFESLLGHLKKAPWRLFIVVGWFWRGRAYAKTRLAESAEFAVATLPYNEAVLELIRSRKASGQRVLLATGSAQGLAQRVADHLGLFDGVIATTASENLIGDVKRVAIEKRLRGESYTYIGNHRNDRVLWRAAAEAITVNPRATANEDMQILVEEDSRRVPWWAALRPRHWLKNALLILPLLLAHRYADPSALSKVTLGIIAFSLLASSAYLVNDLLDLEVDRQHSLKRYRAVAAGVLGVPQALLLAGVCVALGFGIGFVLPDSFVGWLTLYLLTTLAYSLFAKRLLMVDVIVLTGLYVVRLLAGGAAAGVAVSFWLLLFSMFFFLSLALLKRFVEVRNGSTQGRAYDRGDEFVLGQLGVTSATGAVLVLGLYVNSDAVRTLYESPNVIWLLCPLLTFWLGRLWLLGNRGELDEDPVLFATVDVSTWLVLLAAAVLLLVAR
ncbi:MAG: UbiA family prenyltransferase [Gammaproteobacteria bacterium]|nr:UbiA family prenyltransferase [Gammaproteobacteria bacterium]